MSIEVSVEDAYGEACKVIGEQTVTLRVLQGELAKVQTECDALRDHIERSANTSAP